MVDDYGLKVDEEYQDTLDNFLANSQLVKDQEAMEDAIDTMLSNIQFQTIYDEDDVDEGLKICQGVIENTTGKDFSTFTLNYNLINADGVIVETTYDSLNNFKDGTKVQLEFYTYVDFATIEVTTDFYDVD